MVILHVDVRDKVFMVSAFSIFLDTPHPLDLHSHEKLHFLLLRYFCSTTIIEQERRNFKNPFSVSDGIFISKA